jgi:aspartokinase/homoserine dehydrogenase 1
MPAACLKPLQMKLFESLQEHAEHFESIYKEALSKESRLKYVAQFENGKANVGLRFIPKDHPFYNLEGKDNIVLFFYRSLCRSALLIKALAQELQ